MQTENVRSDSKYNHVTGQDAFFNTQGFLQRVPTTAKTTSNQFLGNFTRSTWGSNRPVVFPDVSARTESASARALTPSKATPISVRNK